MDPFAAVGKDGYIYGRGATDDRDNLVACLTAMLLLKERSVPLHRDVMPYEVDQCCGRAGARHL